MGDSLSRSLEAPLRSTVLVLVALVLAISADSTHKEWATSEAKAFLSRVAGVYKQRFKNAHVDGTTYESEDILEVVPVDDSAAYVRMDLEFYNGHSGKIYGIATYGKNSLVYDNGKQGDASCIVEYVWSPDSVLTRADYDQTPGCLSYHGTRGTLDGAKFFMNRRQTIRYMDRLKSSREFGEAMEEYRKRK